MNHERDCERPCPCKAMRGESGPDEWLCALRSGHEGTCQCESCADRGGGINPDLHVGKLLVALDVSLGVSPAIEAAMPPETDPKMVAEKVRLGFVDVLARELGPTWAFVLERGLRVTVHGRTGPIKTAEERRRDLEELLRPAEDLAVVEARTRARREANPDNGKSGWWRVDGIRHNALVRASSESEAIDKAENDGAVGEWEAPSARFMGADLPDVVSL